VKPINNVILVLGPANSGKSEWAEQLATKSPKAVTYIATAIADPNDPAWQEKIQKHIARRPSDWSTQEIPEALVDYLEQQATDQQCLLIDSLGTWVANCLSYSAQQWEIIVNQFLTTIQNTSADVILVAEETGWGVIPAYPAGRVFRDRLGDLTRQMGGNATDVYLVTAGYALPLTQLAYPLGSCE